jgi:hypothetical protein
MHRFYKGIFLRLGAFKREESRELSCTDYTVDKSTYKCKRRPLSKFKGREKTFGPPLAHYFTKSGIKKIVWR